jgi:hypothetical protein
MANVGDRTLLLENESLEATLKLSYGSFLSSVMLLSVGASLSPSANVVIVIPL